MFAARDTEVTRSPIEKNELFTSCRSFVAIATSVSINASISAGPAWRSSACATAEHSAGGEGRLDTPEASVRISGSSISVRAQWRRPIVSPSWGIAHGLASH